MNQKTTTVVKDKDQTFEPNLLAFCCNWCSYAGADLAGLSRLKYPPNIRIIRTMCSGRVDPKFIIDAFENGADGVLIAACHLGDCHYISQNYKTYKRVNLLHKLMDTFGLEKDRLRLEFISAGEGNKFADTVIEMVDKLKELGPSPLNK
ncbi:MAG: hydrogenase iron-sulfur subunit [Candidatus Heimdallarchaeota archaeon]|nr:hydrogenase iron-sulfur subunit [Candidatus Heimdallarchaeota archaeon]MCK5183661.1 hydrogenase iron-sulfur subunit [Candidatus Heimdallarchaeota archaeon]MCK5297459.1 hydrogenase iron-sulfur subunit [Candidatus Heimdallarchaeota archaeon]